MRDELAPGFWPGGTLKLSLSVIATFITHEFNRGPWTSAVQGPIFIKIFSGGLYLVQEVVPKQFKMKLGGRGGVVRVKKLRFASIVGT